MQPKRTRRKAREIPWTPRPITPQELKAIAAGREAFRKAQYITLEALEAYVARRRAARANGRRHKVAPKPR